MLADPINWSEEIAACRDHPTVPRPLRIFRQFNIAGRKIELNGLSNISAGLLLGFIQRMRNRRRSGQPANL